MMAKKSVKLKDLAPIDQFLKRAEKVPFPAVGARDLTSIDQFLETGESKSHWGSSPLLLCREGYVAQEVNGLLYFVGLLPDNKPCSLVRMTKSRWPSELKFELPGAVIVNQKGKNILLANGDMAIGNTATLTCRKGSSITISLTCMDNMFGPSHRVPAESLESWKRVHSIALQLINGKIKLIEATPDKRWNLTAQQRNTIKRLQKHNLTFDKICQHIEAFNPGPLGATLIGHLAAPSWHSPSTCLVEYKGKSFLFGMDEDSYFGSQLPVKAKTIKAALTSLIPISIRRIPGVLRQGEWFAVPVSAKEIPGWKDCFLMGFGGEDTCVTLPLETRDSNRHFLQLISTKKIKGEMRVSAQGVFVKDFSLDHEEHNTLSGEKNKWYTFKKNTAVRSVSADGVD